MEISLLPSKARIEEIKSLCGRQCYEKLNKEVFCNRLPQLRNVYYKQKVSYQERYKWQNDGSIDIHLSIYYKHVVGISYMEQLVIITFVLYKEINETEHSHTPGSIMCAIFHGKNCHIFGCPQRVTVAMA